MTETFANIASTTVSSGGTTAPSSGTVETWTVASSAGFPSASSTASPPTQFHVGDPAAETEVIAVTNVSGTTWTVTRGAENTTPVAHTTGFTVSQVVTSGFLSNVPQGYGLQFFTGGGTISSTTIANAVNAGYTGLFLDPGNIWDMSGVTFNGIQNFLIESRMTGSIGWNGAIDYNTSGAGYIKTSTGGVADGIQVYAATPGGTLNTQGVIFRNCVFVGANSNAVVHYGGGQRKYGLVDTLVYNTNSATGAYGVILDTALSDNNSEDNIFSFTGGGGIAGAYAALGIGIADQTQHANDTSWYDLATAGGSYSIVKDNGGGHTFYNYYDRSNPAIATVYNSGGSRMMFVGGEDRNTVALCHKIDSSSQTTIQNRAVTANTGAAGTVATVSAGALIFRGYSNFNSSGTISLSGSGVLDFADTAVAAANCTVVGSAGKVVLVRNYVTGSSPVLTSFTGSTLYESDNMPGQIVHTNQYAPSTPGSLSLTSVSTFTAVSSNLANSGTFTCPSSGNVKISVNLVSYVSAAINYGYNLAAHATTSPLVSNSVILADSSATIPRVHELEFFVTGLTSGNSYCFDLMAVTGTGTLTVVAVGQSGTAPASLTASRGGPVTFTVQAL